MLPLCASVLALPMKPTYFIKKIEQDGVTQPCSDDNITGPIANILHRAVVKNASNIATIKAAILDFSTLLKNSQF